MRVNLKLNENHFSDNLNTCFELCILCIKNTNNYVIVFSEENEYVEKSKL